jgi:hypothetical protein
MSFLSIKNNSNKIKWIENGILENVLTDHRKYVIWRILSPYKRRSLFCDEGLA